MLSRIVGAGHQRRHLPCKSNLPRIRNYFFDDNTPLCQVESCESFWFQPRREKDHIEKFHQDMNPRSWARGLTNFQSPDEIKVDAIVAAEFQGAMRRGKVTRVGKASKDPKYKAFDVIS